ncbi:MFS transporter [Ruegeria pomeroyi]|uniref:Membrane protein, major facilitator transporter family n=4 Tax=Ruegeria pomeroyi TaxID=89184 RepID=Q5LSI9_RUEPO|nr:MFS transporter [Ruegeria pomeroyi]AAV95058.1 membrane protein, major facilitator transporter family [Ruegeria pomeroyi DSS-3]HCE71681.1 MFS transporter [Ruegeria sp.]NVK98105.1 MFS transporter [Ruegeria pomeroyi]NVL02988.1 MFS transporter [Ruegeria pomeroyi]QWV08636.1 MFS transporter [Ruegeria pomeroyi]
MVRQLLPVSALLLGSALLLFAGGMNSLILPIRGAQEGFSASALGLLGTGWALGYVAGCFYTPRLVGKVGHVRAFSVMSGIAAVAVLLSLLLLTPWTWIPLRAMSGFCFAGAAMIVESWLSERAEPSTRGRIFGLYTMVNLGASTAGQLVLTMGDTTGFMFFVLPAIFYCLALMPTAMSSKTVPKPLVSVRLDLMALWRNSPVAVIGVLCVGVSNSAFGTLSAVYADGIGLALTTVALFASLPVLAGAVSQIPIGWLSDRLDRRAVLIGVAVLALAVDTIFIVLSPETRMLNLVLASLFGAAIYAMYPIIIAHANDHAAADQAIQVSGGLLMLYGLGSILGPLLAGFGMETLGGTGLFMTSAGAHVLLILFSGLRILLRAPVAEADKSSFVPAPAGRATTPETAALASAESDEVDEDEEETPSPDAG